MLVKAITQLVLLRIVLRESFGEHLGFVVYLWMKSALLELFSISLQFLKERVELFLATRESLVKGLT
jgi:hypothetical protein